MTEVVSLHQQSDGNAICMTPTVKAIQSVLKICDEARMLGAVVGNPGTGKTTAIEAYAESNRGVMLCRMTKTASTIQPMLARLNEQLGGYAKRHAGAAELHQTVLENLNRYGGVSLLVLDEAQLLSDEAIEEIRDIYDEAQIGVMLVGNYALNSRWEPPSNERKAPSRGNRGRDRFFSPLLGRIGTYYEIPKPVTKDIRMLCDYYGISGKEAQKIIQGAASKIGGLHNVDNLVRAARTISTQDKVITLNNLATAAMVTGIGDKR